MIRKVLYKLKPGIKMTRCGLMAIEDVTGISFGEKTADIISVAIPVGIVLIGAYCACDYLLEGTVDIIDFLPNVAMGLWPKRKDD
ncbi:MAG: hypothetical protein P4L62_00770 [Candidatus Pacebacteria bacterium]|nr:hypothetical protein [Candidatus Paceibacterota bacterium]